jgi:hypothetical protein
VTKTASNSDLESAPGVGPSIARDLRDLGFQRIQDLRGADPETMYDKLRLMRGGYMDHCVLYTFRCAVYFANNSTHDPELLKWWNWKDRASPVLE